MRAPSARARENRWLDRARRWKRRLLDAFAPIGVAADGDTMLDPSGDLVLDGTGEIELQDSTDCSACCGVCWDNVSIPSVKIELDGSFTPCSGTVLWSAGCSGGTDPGYGTSCDPCGVDYYEFQSGSLTGTYNLTATSTPSCPGFGGGSGGPGGWTACVESPITWLFSTGTHTDQRISPQFLLFLLTICPGSPGCVIDLQIILVGCACGDGPVLFTLFNSQPGLTVNPMPESLVIDNYLSVSGTCPGWGGTATLTKGP